MICSKKQKIEQRFDELVDDEKYEEAIRLLVIIQKVSIITFRQFPSQYHPALFAFFEPSIDEYVELFDLVIEKRLDKDLYLANLQIDDYCLIDLANCCNVFTRNSLEIFPEFYQKNFKDSCEFFATEIKNVNERQNVYRGVQILEMLIHFIYYLDKDQKYQLAKTIMRFNADTEVPPNCLFIFAFISQF